MEDGHFRGIVPGIVVLLLGLLILMPGFRIRCVNVLDSFADRLQHASSVKEAIQDVFQYDTGNPN